ncbi:DNA repair protein RadA, partial [Actinotignum timonense]|nr:DNA repair protein RadA [Actinotignum timonense]
VSMTLEGRRPMPVEVQGLVVPSSGRPEPGSGKDFDFRAFGAEALAVDFCRARDCDRRGGDV